MRTEVLTAVFFFIGLASVFGLQGGEGFVTDIKNDEQLANASEPVFETTLIYIYDKEVREKDLHERFVEFAKKMEGFGVFYAGKCSDLNKNFTHCADTVREQRPMLLINRPPEYKVNPYTNKPMEVQRIKYMSKPRSMTIHRGDIEEHDCYSLDQSIDYRSS